MKLLPSEMDEASLSRLGQEVLSLLEQGDYQSLAERFGYALAYGEDPARVIEEELNSCIASYHASAEPRPPVLPSISVKYFRPGDAGLFALVECVWIAANRGPLLVELIVTSTADARHITLEQISPAAA